MKILKECKLLYSIHVKIFLKIKELEKLSYAFDFEWTNKIYFMVLIKEQIVF